MDSRNYSSGNWTYTVVDLASKEGAPSPRPSRRDPAEPTPRDSTSIFILSRLGTVFLLAVLALLLLPAAVDQSACVVSIDGVPVAVSPGTTADQILGARPLTPRSGSQLDFTGDVFALAAGEQGAVEVNGTPATPAQALGDGAVIVGRQGAGLLEELTTKVVEIPSRIVVQGEGWDVKVTQKGQPGKQATYRGASSTRELVTLTTQEALNTVAVRSSSTPTKKKVVALTFDDGPGAFTGRVLDILANEGVPATFFICGSCVPGNEALLERMRKAGHEIENHTWSHPWLTKISLDSASRELTRTSDVIGGALFLRPPGGFVDSSIIELAAEQGLIIAMWDVDTRDWEVRNVNSIMANVKAEVRPGAVILMHDGGGDRTATIAALPQVIDWLRSQGYSFTTLRDLVGA